MAACGVVMQSLGFTKCFIFYCIFQVAHSQTGFQVFQKDNESSLQHILEIKAMFANLDRRMENLERNFAMTSAGDLGSGSYDYGRSTPLSRDSSENIDENFVNSVLEQVRRTCVRSNSQIFSKMTDQLRNLELWNLEFKREYTMDMQKLLFQRDCDDYKRKGHMQSGVYTIYPIQQSSPVRVYCDLELDNAGWTVIQSRGHGKANHELDFHRDWRDYKLGFGNPGADFWLGNEAVHHITSRTTSGCMLRIELRNSKDGRLWVAQYARFSLGSEAEKYVLRLQSYSGNASDGLHLHHGRPFCTWDREEDPASRGCAWLERSGWWFHPVVTPPFRRTCSYPLAGTNLNAPARRAELGAPEVHAQALTLQAPTNGSVRYAFVFLGILHWMDKDGRHFDQVQMKIRPNF